MNAGRADGLADRFLNGHLDELVAMRHHLHAHPEPSHHEVVTTELIAERLRIAGLDPVTLSSGTGLTCDLGPPDQPRVALRADIDALLMQDAKEVPHASTVPGVAHACGHDLHTVVVLGAGLALASLPEERRPSVRLVFEPAEESVPGGAVTVIGDGALDGVTEIHGFHADPRLDVGTVGVRDGALTAAADIVEIHLAGPGGHTARPELTVDLVAEAARIVADLPRRVAARAGDDGRLDLVFGSSVAGDAANVIPTTARLAGSVRTADGELWERARWIVESELEAMTADSGAEVACSYRRGVPPVRNDAAVAERVRAVAEQVLGAAGVVEPPRSQGGDSFAWYQQQVPGCYTRLGVHDPSSGAPRLDLHSGAFDVDDRAIEVGVRIMLGLVVGG